MGCQAVPGSPREPAPQAAPITVIGRVLRRGRFRSLGGHGCDEIRFAGWPYPRSRLRFRMDVGFGVKRREES